MFIVKALIAKKKRKLHGKKSLSNKSSEGVRFNKDLVNDLEKLAKAKLEPKESNEIQKKLTTIENQLPMLMHTNQLLLTDKIATKDKKLTPTQKALTDFVENTTDDKLQKMAKDMNNINNIKKEGEKKDKELQDKDKDLQYNNRQLMMDKVDKLFTVVELRSIYKGNTALDSPSINLKNKKDYINWLLNNVIQPDVIYEIVNNNLNTPEDKDAAKDELLKYITNKDIKRMSDRLKGKEKVENIENDNDNVDDEDISSGNVPKDALTNKQIQRMMSKYLNYRGIITKGLLPEFLQHIDLNLSSDNGFIVLLPNKNSDIGHWVAINLHLNSPTQLDLEYYDSFGNKPPFNIVHTLLPTIKKYYSNIKTIQLKINIIKEQQDNKYTCGWHAMKFLIDRWKGIPFKVATRFIDNSKLGEQKISNMIDKFRHYSVFHVL